MHGSRERPDHNGAAGNAHNRAPNPGSFIRSEIKSRERHILERSEPPDRVHFCSRLPLDFRHASPIPFGEDGHRRDAIHSNTTMSIIKGRLPGPRGESRPLWLN